MIPHDCSPGLEPKISFRCVKFYVCIWWFHMMVRQVSNIKHHFDSWNFICVPDDVAALKLIHWNIFNAWIRVPCLHEILTRIGFIRPKKWKNNIISGIIIFNHYQSTHIMFHLGKITSFVSISLRTNCFEQLGAKFTSSAVQSLSKSSLALGTSSHLSTQVTCLAQKNPFSFPQKRFLNTRSYKSISTQFLGTNSKRPEQVPALFSASDLQKRFFSQNNSNDAPKNDSNQGKSELKRRICAVLAGSGGIIYFFMQDKIADAIGFWRTILVGLFSIGTIIMVIVYWAKIFVQGKRNT